MSVAIDDRSFSIRIAQDDADSVEDPYTLHLLVTYTDTYPETMPELEFEDDSITGELSSQQLSTLMSEIKALAEESLGMAMVFTVIMHIKDNLDSLAEQKLQRITQEETARKVLEEEKENAKFHGTSVTPESFMKWKKAFDREIALKDKERLRLEELKKKKPTGRMMFEQDLSLATSDAQFMEEGDVEVDLSLFTDEMDNLGINDDEDHVANMLRGQD